MALTKPQIRELQRASLDGPNKVRKAMGLAGVTQVQVARAIGITQPHVSEIVNGKYSSLPLDTARDFADFFGCALDDLFPRQRKAVA